MKGEDLTMTDMTAQKTAVSFGSQRDGYDREQVDQYISNLAEAYRAAYDEYQAVCAKYDGIMLEHRKILEEKEHTRPSADAIARTLVDTEVLARKILEDAAALGDKAVAQAKEEAKRIIDDAYVDAATVKIQTRKMVGDAAAQADELKEEARKLIDDAKSQAEEARLTAQKIVDDARYQAELINIRAEKNVGKATEEIARLIRDMSVLISGEESETQE